ncbi:MAG: HU family DNA-binding protein [Proteobacteria bacterium]|uniref:HU family DNA-binding protein n=1 Tax=Candidatus Avisuccinivibrio stercorigallinarum TaxID=2840704 RepID=A0A9D9D9X7_9GAMM|nr:HU family DNA-binding protein [Candidatus Avisuccinivibrio stercorigallinarum]
MNKGQLVDKIAEKTNLSLKDSQAALNAFVDTVKDTLVSGESISLVGFGTFLVRERSERMGRNPRTKEEVHIPAGKVPAFKAGKSLKDSLNNK